MKKEPAIQRNHGERVRRFSGTMDEEFVVLEKLWMLMKAQKESPSFSQTTEKMPQVLVKSSEAEAFCMQTTQSQLCYDLTTLKVKLQQNLIINRCLLVL